MEESSFWIESPCYHEPKVHDHELYQQLITINLWLLIPLTLIGLFFNASALISRPVVSRMKDTVKRAHIIVFIVLSITFIFRLPIFLIELQVKEKPELLIRRRPTATEFLSLYRIVYHSFLEPILCNVLPFLAMSIFSILTLSEICRSAHFHYSQFSFEGKGVKKVASSQPLRTCLQKKADALRQKQELRATISIVLIILLYLVFHSLQLYDVVRKWQLLFSSECPTRRDYLQSHIGTVLSLLSATVDAFVFIAFTNRLRQYVQMLIRKTSRTLSNSSEPPLSPRTTTTIEAAPLTATSSRSYRQDGTFV
ncbi:hypothetical protein QR680_002117 [Steinernema hermaphroditum]|uniref:G-protein coupled receptors family 1 profile domain-containing protein n=1 Tax=Steinernema hermaphroditum TaxID=289476 RepID=A0AA39H1E7_9BILA|nr:hypothetical protein QR680_002117 [Steinernema hermaphroditum]